MPFSKVSAPLAAFFLALSTGILMVVIPNQYQAIYYNYTITAVVLTRVNLYTGIIGFISLGIGVIFAFLNLRSETRVKSLIIAIIIPLIFAIWYGLIPLGA